MGNQIRLANHNCKLSPAQSPRFATLDSVMTHSVCVVANPGPPAKASPRRVGAHRCHSEIAILRTEPGHKCWRWPVGHDAPLSSWADVARPDPSMGGPAGGSGAYAICALRAALCQVLQERLYDFLVALAIDY